MPLAACYDAPSGRPSAPGREGKWAARLNGPGGPINARAIGRSASQDRAPPRPRPRIAGAARDRRSRRSAGRAVRAPGPRSRRRPNRPPVPPEPGPGGPRRRSGRQRPGPRPRAPGRDRSARVRPGAGGCGPGRGRPDRCRPGWRRPGWRQGPPGQGAGGAGGRFGRRRDRGPGARVARSALCRDRRSRAAPAIRGGGCGGARSGLADRPIARAIIGPPGPFNRTAHFPSRPGALGQPDRAS